MSLDSAIRSVPPLDAEPEPDPPGVSVVPPAALQLAPRASTPRAAIAPIHDRLNMCPPGCGGDPQNLLFIKHHRCFVKVTRTCRSVPEQLPRPDIRPRPSNPAPDRGQDQPTLQPPSITSF